MSKYTNSPLVSVTRLSPNHSGQRTHAIDRITPHCVVGYCTAEGLGGWFAAPSTQASSNYGIDKDGRVGLYVEEKNRSWCTSSKANDQRAITIECASDTKKPYSFRDVTYQKLVELCVDICRRNGKNRLIWIEDKNTALNYTPGAGEMLLTVHRWFANKSCPGNWLFARMGDLAARVTAALESSTQPQPAPDPAPQPQPATDLKVGDIVSYTGKIHYASANASTGPSCKPGKAKVTALYPSGKHPVHLIAISGGGSTVYGWVDTALIQKDAAEEKWIPKVGDIVDYKGTTHYTSANASTPKGCKGGMAKITQIYQLGKSKHPYHLIRVSGSGATVYGWVDADSFTKA